MTDFDIHIQRQPDDSTCGPTALHAVYRYYGDDAELDQLVDEIHSFDDGGGTLAVMLGCHALRRGYRATIYTYNLQMFDPTWFREGVDLAEKVRLQGERKRDPKLRAATGAYLEFLRSGGRVRFEDLTVELLCRYLERRVPILTGLSATNLYQAAREDPSANEPDDVAGYPVGHFVVVCGHRDEPQEVLVADPLQPNPVSHEGRYWVTVDRFVSSVMLGIVTYDANLLVIERHGATE